MERHTKVARLLRLAPDRILGKSPHRPLVRFVSYKSNNSSLGMYTGSEKIVVGVDLGTTMSSTMLIAAIGRCSDQVGSIAAVSYAHLVPDTIPEARIVNRWPGQEEVSGESKVRLYPL